jgi:hypothetical protein
MKNFFFKQTDNDSCGPIAFLNYLKLTGRKVSKKKDLPFLKIILDWQPVIGSVIEKYEEGFKEFGIDSEVKNKISYIDLNNQLKKGPLILSYSYKDDKDEILAHTVLVYGKKRNKYLVTNWKSGFASSEIKEEEMYSTIAIARRIQLRSCGYPTMIYEKR